ncbi:MAG: hypothetical protein GY797_37105 [Deltaproteobacteria bacterium]|nr:hypothetical protein [Deltaproteobacteria bacterium]
MIMLQIQRSENMIVKNMTAGTTRWIGILWLIISLFLVSTTGWGADLQFEWPDYQEPFRRNIWIRQNGSKLVESAIITVDLADHFLKNHKKIILVIDIESRTKGDFKHFKPYIKVGDSVLSSYKIPVKISSNRQTQQIEIKINI